jgi:hypothetical protein
MDVLHASGAPAFISKKVWFTLYQFSSAGDRHLPTTVSGTAPV